MRLYNTLTRKLEEFVPIKPPQVGMYACGVTVYDYAHVGHMRKYVGDDILRRVLEYLGYQVTLVMNITDVGHLTSDADTGEDKMEKGARRLNKTAWEVAEMFTQQFFDSARLLNIRQPDVVCKATDHITEQINLVKKLEEKGYAYKTSDGVYFDTSKFLSYGEMARLNAAGMEEGARVEKNPEKRNPTDFALWKFSPSLCSGQARQARRDMEWDSPWGKGFPGWHIECSAMSMRYLGEQFDIHTGGIDHIQIHHTNEIAQSEAATGRKPFVRFWVHHNFLQVEGQKMSKSLGNIYTVQDVIEKGFEPLALRYLYLTAHYRAEMNFTFAALTAAQTAYRKLSYQVSELSSETSRTELSPEKLAKIDAFRDKFLAAISDDLAMPEVVAVVWEVVKSNIPDRDKYELLANFDQVLGLGLGEIPNSKFQIPNEIQELVNKRETLRKEGKFEEADEVRKQIEKRGFVVEDTSRGPLVREK